MRMINLQFRCIWPFRDDLIDVGDRCDRYVDCSNGRVRYCVRSMLNNVFMTDKLSHINKTDVNIISAFVN